MLARASVERDVEAAGAAGEATPCLSPSSGGSSHRAGVRCSRRWLRREAQRSRPSHDGFIPSVRPEI